MIQEARYRTDFVTAAYTSVHEHIRSCDCEGTHDCPLYRIGVVVNQIVTDETDGRRVILHPH